MGDAARSIQVQRQRISNPHDIKLRLVAVCGTPTMEVSAQLLEELPQVPLVASYTFGVSLLSNGYVALRSCLG